MGEDIMDYTERCRLCIAGSKRLSIDIFSPEGKRSKLQSKINKYLSLKISEDDKLPSSICYQCLFRLETWVSFKKHCLDSDQTLKNWAFFCGAITPESYLNEANKSSENGSDVEKPSSYFSSKDNETRSRHRTPPSRDNSAPGPSHTPPQTVSPSPSAPLSSSSSTSSQQRGSEAREKSSKVHENSPLNGVTIEPVRTSKSGRRKILRPTKAFTTGKGDEHEIQLVAIERKVPVEVHESPTRRKSEEVKLPKELLQKQTSPTLPLTFKRKRGRPSKAWLRERAEALKKLKEAAQNEQQVSPKKEHKEPQEQKERLDPREPKEPKESKELRDPKEVDEPKELREYKEKKETKDMRDPKEMMDPKEIKDPKEMREPKEIKDPKEMREPKEPKCLKSSKSKTMTEMIELDDPDFGSMKFTLSYIDSSAVPSSEKTAVYPESSTSTSSGRLSSDSCLKEEFSGFSNQNRDPKRMENIGVASTVDFKDPTSDRLSEPCASELSEMPLSPQKPDRKRSHSALGHSSYEESEEKVKKLEDSTSRSLESLKECSVPVVITALSQPSPDRIKTEEDVRSGEGDQIIVQEINIDACYDQSEVEIKDEPPVEDDSDSDLVAPPMSPLSPARINFEVIELREVQEMDTDRNDELEY